MLEFMTPAERKDLTKSCGRILVVGWIGVFTAIGAATGYDYDKKSRPRPNLEPNMEMQQHSAERRGYSSLEAYHKVLLERNIKAYEEAHKGERIAGLGTLMCGLTGLAIGLASAPMVHMIYRKGTEESEEDSD